MLGLEVTFEPMRGRSGYDDIMSCNQYGSCIHLLTRVSFSLSFQVVGFPNEVSLAMIDSTNTNEWSSESGSFALAAGGDTIILYCRESDNSITHLTALSYSGDWLPASTDEDSFGTESSALPASLPSNTAIALPHKDNYWYVGPRQGNTSSLLDSLSDPNEWEGSNTETFQLGAMEPKFMEPTTTSNATTITTLKKWIPLVGMAILVIATTFYVL